MSLPSTAPTGHEVPHCVAPPSLASKDEWPGLSNIEFYEQQDFKTKNII